MCTVVRILCAMRRKLSRARIGPVGISERERAPVAAMGRRSGRRSQARAHTSPDALLCLPHPDSQAIEAAGRLVIARGVPRLVPVLTAFLRKRGKTRYNQTLAELRPSWLARLTLENPKVVGRFYFGAIALALVFALISRICLGDFSPLLWTTEVIAAMLLACVFVSMILTIVFAPVLWLLSRLSGRGKIEDHSEEKGK